MTGPVDQQAKIYRASGLSGKKLKSMLRSTSSIAAAGLLALGIAPAYADPGVLETPTGENVVGGSASFDRPSAGELNITQNTQRTVIEWDTFNIGVNAKTEFFQPNAQALAVNRVLDTNVSEIFGTLKANGRLMVLNGNGVLFGADSKVDVGGIIASTGDVSNATVMSGAEVFDFDNFGDGAIENYGTITVAEAGLAAFVAPNVVNHGVINAKLGTVAFGAGETVTVDFYGDGLYEIAVDGELAEARLVNAQDGEINAEGGNVVMSVNAAKAIVNNVINLNGVAKVTSVSEVDGKIVLNSEGAGRVQLAGDVDAGDIEASGESVRVKNGADVDAGGAVTLETDSLDIENNTSITGNEIALLRRSVGETTLGSEVVSHLSLTQDELDKLTTSLLTVGNPVAGESGTTDINVGAVDMTAFGTVDLNALAASAVTFSNVASFGNLAVNTDNIFVNAAISASGVDFTATDSIELNDFVTTLGGDTSFAADSFNVAPTGGVSTLGGAIDISTDNAAIAGLLSAGPGTISLYRQTMGEISLGAVNTGLHLDNSELANLVAGGLVVGNADSGLSNTTDINVEDANIAHIAAVDLNALAASSIDFAGMNYFASLNAATDIINVLNGSVNATAGINFDAPEVNLNGDLNAPVITGTATDIEVQSDSAQIQDAVDVAGSGAGAVIEVASGTYTEAVTIGKNDITLNGANAGVNPNTSVRGPESLILPGLAAGFTINGDSVTLDGFTVGNGLAGVDLSGSSNAAVQNNIFTGGLWGAFANGASDVTLLDNQIKNVTAQGVNFSFLAGSSSITGNSIDGNGISTMGIVLTDSDDVTIDGNTIEEVQHTAVNISDSSHVTADGNSLFGDGDHAGFDINDGSNIAVTGNTIDDFETGVDVNGTAAANISGNTITSVEYGVLADTVSALTVSGNSIFGNSTTGIDVLNSDGALIEGNDVHDFITGIKITDSHDNVRVLDNDVENSETGILADNAENIWISGNDVDNSTAVGIHLKNSDGTDYVDDSDIWNNRVTSAAGATGILVENSAYATVGSHNTSPGDTLANGNVVTGGADGIVINNSVNAMVRYNTVHDVAGEGVDINSSGNSSVLDNDIDNTGTNGISLNPSHGSVVSDNTIDNAGTNAIYVLGSNDVDILNNTATGGQTGVRVENSNGIEIIGNMLSGQIGGTSVNGIGDAINLDNSDGALIDLNIISGSSDDGIDLENGSDNATISNNSVTTVTDNGITVRSDSDNADITGNTVTGAGDTGVRVYDGADNSDVDGNTVSSTGAHGIFVAANAISVDNNVVHNTGNDGIEISNSANVSVDGNKVGMNAAETAQGTDNIGGEGIDVNNSATAQITDNKVTETVSNGISINPSPNSLISGNTISNVGANGIDVAGSNGTTVDNNDIDVAVNGVNVTGSNDVTISDNEIDDVSESGIYVENGDDTQVVSNEINDNGATTYADYGIRIEGGNSADIDNNKIEETNVAGIAANNTTFIDIDGNTVKDGHGEGILVTNGYNADIRTNTVQDHADDGIDVQNHDNVDIERNTVVRSGDSGITVRNGSNNAFIDENDVDVAANGIRVTDSNDATVSDNEIDDASNTGIWSLNSDDTQILSNEINDNGASTYVNYGILVDGGNSVDVDFNTVEETNIAGIAALNTTYIDVDDNTVKDGNGDGILVEDGYNADIRRNTVQDHADDGIDVQRHNNVEILENTVLRSGDSGITVRDNSGNAFVDANDVDVATNGIRVTNSDDAVVTNNDVDDASNTGIWSLNSNNTLIEENEINDNGASSYVDHGILVEGGSNVDVLNNKIEETNFAGIKGLNTTFVDIEDNLVKDGNGDGILVQNSGNADVKLNTIQDHDGDGIDVESSNDASIADNEINDTGENGIELQNSNNALISGNDIEDAGENGIYVNPSENVDILNNVISGTDENGIFVTGGNFILIDGNFVDDTGVDGIHVEEIFTVNDGFAPNVTVSNNEVGTEGDIGGDGIEVFDVVSSLIEANTVGSEETDVDGNGILVTTEEEDDPTLITGNFVYNVDMNGVMVTAVDTATITNNVIDGTGENGIYAWDNDTLFVTGNDIDNAESSGINAGRYLNAEVTGNTVNDVGEDGIFADGYNDDGLGFSILVSGNSVEDVGGDGIQVGYTDDVTITGNNVTDVYGVGIDVYNAGFVNVNNNDTLRTGSHGIDVSDSGYADIVDNTIADAGYNAGEDNEDGYFADGIHVENVYGYNNGAGEEVSRPGPYVNITGNDIDRTADDGIEVVDSGTTVIDDNDVYEAGYGNEGYFGGYFGGYYGGDEYGADGIHVRGVHGGNEGFKVTVTNNVVDTVGDDGVEVMDSDETLVDNNIISWTGLNTYYGGYQGIINIEDEYLGANDGDGVHIVNVWSDGYYGNSVEVTNNTISHTGDDGVDVHMSGTTLVGWNTVTNAGYGKGGDYEGGDEGWGHDGIHVGQAFANDGGFTDPDGEHVVKIIGNSVDVTGDDGIQVHAAGRTLVEGNTVSNAGIGDDGYYGLGDAHGADGIVVHHIHDEGGLYDIAAAGYFGGGYYGYAVDIIDNTISNTADDGIEVFNAESTYIAGNDVSNAGYFGGYYGGYYGGEWSSDGIHVRNVNGGYYGPGIFDNGQFTSYAVVIDDNMVDTTADDGIEVRNSGKTRITNNRIYNAGYGDGGYYGGGDYYGADGIHVYNVFDNSGYYGGYFGGYYGGPLDRAVLIRGNYVDTTHDDGIEVVNSGRTWIARNDVTQTGYGYFGGYYGYYGYGAPDGYGADGIHVRNVEADGYYGGYYGGGVGINNVQGLGNAGILSLFDVVIRQNDVSYAGDDGIEVRNFNTAFAGKNIVSTVGGDGIDVDDASHVEIMNNEVYGNGDNGIEVDDIYGARTVIIDNNEVYDNEDDGIDVDDAESVFITNNEVYDNGDDGIEVEDAGHVEITDNEVYNNGFGYYGGYYGYYGDGNGIEVDDVYGYDTLIISGNTVFDNADDGIEVDDSNHVEILENDVFGNGDDGIDVDGIYDEETLIITGNLIENNADNGIVVQNSITTEIADNIINNNGSRGLFMKGPYNQYITVSGNSFTGNPVGAHFESGEIDLTGEGNAFFGGDVAMLFAPAPLFYELQQYEEGGEGLVPVSFAPMRLVDDTIGSQFFSGQSEFFVELDNGAFFEPGTPTILDATDSTFDTPFGNVNPSATGDLIGADAFAFLEDMFFHFNDRSDLGLFFFGNILSQDIDQEDIFNRFGPFSGVNSGLNVTLTGLPSVPGTLAETLAGIAPAAGEGGEEDDEEGLTAEELAELEPAAGGEEVACWGDAVLSAGTGAVVSYNYRLGGQEVLSDAGGCQTQQF